MTEGEVRNKDEAEVCPAMLYALWRLQSTSGVKPVKAATSQRFPISRVSSSLYPFHRQVLILKYTQLLIITARSLTKSGIIVSQIISLQ